MNQPPASQAPTSSAPTSAATEQLGTGRAWDTLPPRIGVTAQLAAATATWLAGALFLLVRGVWFAEEPGAGFAVTGRLLLALGLGLTVGLVKARFVLAPYAAEAATRIRKRGRAFALGFFAPKSWLFIAGMMGLGIAARHSVLASGPIGREFLAALYLAVGTALIAAAAVLAAALAEQVRN